MSVVITNIDVDFTTNNNEITEAAEFPIEIGEVAELKLSVIGIAEDGTDAACFEVRANFYRLTDGTVKFMGPVSDVFPPAKSNGAALWDIELEPDGSGNVELRLKGADGKNVGWSIFGSLDKMTPVIA